MKMTIQEIREKLGEFLPRVEELNWRNHALGQAVNLTRVYREYRDIFEMGALDMVLDAGLDEPRNLFLYGTLLRERLDARVSHIDDQVGRILTTAVVRVGAEEFPYNMAVAMISRAGDQQRRRRIRDALVPVHERLNELLKQKDDLVKQELTRMGQDYVDASEMIRLVDLEALGTRADEFLNATRDVYLGAMDALLQQRLGMGLPEARRFDIPRLFSGLWWSQWFPPEQLVPGLYRALDAMGVDPIAGGRILIHTEDLPKKAPRAACFAIIVPDDIRLSVKPIGGFSDYDALFHEMGHAQHFANTRQEEMEFRYLGSMAITETHAFFMEGLLEHPDVLMDVAGMGREQAVEVAHFKAVQKLYVARRYAAKLLYELQWHGGQANEPRQAYGKYLGRAYGMPMEDADTLSFMLDHDDFFYSADYLRAWYIKSLLERTIAGRFGQQWFRTHETGNALQGLWTLGQKPLPRELAETLGGKEFDPLDYARTLAERIEKWETP